MRPIPKKLKTDILLDPFYTQCCLKGTQDHICGGPITWEHTIIFANKQLNEKWAIIPLCARGHAVNLYQDAGTMDKERNVWVALNRTTTEQLKAISKVIQYVPMRDRLNNKFGPYVPLIGNEINY